MKVQINNKFVKAKDSVILGKMEVLITPPLNEDYWVFRVPLTENQALVAFSKFSTYGIGFQKEEDWNINLPYEESPKIIYDFIKHNKGNENITKEKTIKAIKLLQEAIITFKREGGLN